MMHVDWMRALTVTGLALTAVGCGSLDPERPGVISQSKLIDPSRGQAAVPLKARWLGVGGVDFEFDGQIFVVDPYLTRTVNDEPPAGFTWQVYPGFSPAVTGEVCGSKISGQQAWGVIDDYVSRLGGKPIHSIYVTHTHWDHAADVPLLVLRQGGTSWGGTVYGSVSMRNLMEAYKNFGNGGYLPYSPFPPGSVRPEKVDLSSKVRLALVNTSTPAAPLSAPGLPAGVVYESKDKTRRVEVTAYLWEHTAADKLTDDGQYGGKNIDPALDPVQMLMYDYKQAQMSAYLFKFVDGDRSTTVFVGAAANDPTTTNLSLPYLKAAYPGGIDAAYVTVTHWYGTAEEPAGMSDILTNLRPKLVIPTHFDDYYWPIINTAPTWIDNADWHSCTYKTLQHQFPGWVGGDFVPHYLLTLASLNEVDSMIADIMNMGTAVVRPWMFGTQINGYEDPQAQFSLLAEKSSSNTPSCVRASSGSLSFGSCLRGTTKDNQWSLEPSGHLENKQSGTCLNKKAGSTTDVEMGACTSTATSWAYTDATGLLYTGSGSSKRCLQKTYDGAAKKYILQLAACSCDKAAQKWSLWTTTHVDLRDSPDQLSMSRRNATLSNGTPVDVQFWNGWSGAVDPTGFIYEPQTGFLRVADDPSFCLKASNLAWATIEKCYQDTNQDRRAWNYDTYNGELRARLNTSMCLVRVQNGGAFGVYRGACDWSSRWTLFPSRGHRVGTVTGWVWGPGGGINGATVTIGGCDCPVTTKTSGTQAGSYACTAVSTGATVPSTGSQPVQVTAAPCPYLPGTLNSVWVRGEQSVSGPNLILPERTTATLTGKVSLGAAPLSGVGITLTAGTLTKTTTTSSKGAYSFGTLDRVLGTVTLVFSKTGYYSQTKTVPLTCTPTLDIKVDITMLPLVSPTPIPL